MATVYPTAAGAWSTRTWNDDSTGAAYGAGTPQTGDTVHANNLAITLDTDITVAALSTRAGTTAAAGGSFSTSGARIVNADSYAGSISCLALVAASGSIQNGNSYGSNTTNTRYGTTIASGCIQNGNSTGGNGTNRIGSQVAAGGIQNGDSTGGSGNAAYGSTVQVGGVQYGNATGGSVSGAHGTNIAAGGLAIIETASGATSGAFGVYSSATDRYVALIKNESGSYPKSLTAQAETTDTNVPFVNYNAGGGGAGIARLTRGGLVG